MCLYRVGKERPTFLHRLTIITPLLEALHILRQPHPRPQFLLQNITLIQKQDELDAREEPVRADHLPEEHGVLEPVDGAVLGEDLVEAGDGGEEDDGVDWRKGEGKGLECKYYACRKLGLEGSPSSK